MLHDKILSQIRNYFQTKRTPLSKKYPTLYPYISFIRRNQKKFFLKFSKDITFSHSQELLPFIATRHQSLLRRKLGDSHPRLQENKIININKAVEKLNGVVIQPNEIFSFWKIVGDISYKEGYVDGMLLSDGKIIEGVGGGICQLSNLLYWLWIHVPSQTIERYHHSFDVFPDSGRVLPFGSGATLVYNTVDLKVRNLSEVPLQIHLWLTDKHLKGEIRSMFPIGEKFHIQEKNHRIIKFENHYFRYNELYQIKKVNGRIIDQEKLTTNFAPILYPISDSYITENNFLLLDYTSLLGK